MSFILMKDSKFHSEREIARPVSWQYNDGHNSSITHWDSWEKCLRHSNLIKPLRHLKNKCQKKFLSVNVKEQDPTKPKDTYWFQVRNRNLVYVPANRLFFLSVSIVPIATFLFVFSANHVKLTDICHMLFGYTLIFETHCLTQWVSSLISTKAMVVKRFVCSLVFSATYAEPQKQQNKLFFILWAPPLKLAIAMCSFCWLSEAPSPIVWLNWSQPTGSLLPSVQL